MKVFIVTSGIFADYQVERVFSKKELAEQWIGDMKYYDPNDCDVVRIEEHEVDNLDNPLIPKASSIKVNLFTGEILNYYSKLNYTDLNVIEINKIAKNMHENQYLLTMEFDFYDQQKAIDLVKNLRENILNKYLKSKQINTKFKIQKGEIYEIN